MEQWKDIEHYIGLYQVSDLGRVRSLDRIVDRNGIKVFRNGKGQLKHSRRKKYLKLINFNVKLNNCSTKLI